jgi:hypothetical protein
VCSLTLAAPFGLGDALSDEELLPSFGVGAEGMTAENDEDLPPFKFVFNPRSILKLRKVRQVILVCGGRRPRRPRGKRTVARGVAAVRLRVATQYAHTAGHTRIARCAPRFGRAGTRPVR